MDKQSAFKQFLTSLLEVQKKTLNYSVTESVNMCKTNPIDHICECIQIKRDELRSNASRLRMLDLNSCYRAILNHSIFNIDAFVMGMRITNRLGKIHYWHNKKQLLVYVSELNNNISICYNYRICYMCAYKLLCYIMYELTNFSVFSLEVFLYKKYEPDDIKHTFIPANVAIMNGHKINRDYNLISMNTFKALRALYIKTKNPNCVNLMNLILRHNSTGYDELMVTLKSYQKKDKFEYYIDLSKFRYTEFDELFDCDAYDTDELKDHLSNPKYNFDKSYMSLAYIYISFIAPKYEIFLNCRNDKLKIIELSNTCMESNKMKLSELSIFITLSKSVVKYCERYLN